MESGFKVCRRGRAAVYQGISGSLFLGMAILFCAPAAIAALPDACSLLSNADVHALAPSLGKGRPGNVRFKNVSTCEWPDAHGIPALTAQVNPAPPHSLVKDLSSGIAAMGGYDIKSISGLGDEAAMAVQRANPKYHLKEGIAILSVRVGKRVVSLSPMRIKIKPGTAKFRRLKRLAAKAVSRL
jgi:hypothetical protein